MLLGSKHTRKTASNTPNARARLRMNMYTIYIYSRAYDTLYMVNEYPLCRHTKKKTTTTTTSTMCIEYIIPSPCTLQPKHKPIHNTYALLHCIDSMVCIASCQDVFDLGTDVHETRSGTMNHHCRRHHRRAAAQQQSTEQRASSFHHQGAFARVTCVAFLT